MYDNYQLAKWIFLQISGSVLFIDYLQSRLFLLHIYLLCTWILDFAFTGVLYNCFDIYILIHERHYNKP